LVEDRRGQRRVAAQPYDLINGIVSRRLPRTLQQPASFAVARRPRSSISSNISTHNGTHLDEPHFTKRRFMRPSSRIMCALRYRQWHHFDTAAAKRLHPRSRLPGNSHMPVF
jgi:hypothetical protein